MFFRAWTKAQAEALAVAGWVRNRDDGSVEAHVEGGETEVGQLIDRLREGPRGARVDGIDVRNTDVRHFTTFEVRP